MHLAHFLTVPHLGRRRLLKPKSRRALARSPLSAPPAARILTCHTLCSYTILITRGPASWTCWLDEMAWLQIFLCCCTQSVPFSIQQGNNHARHHHKRSCPSMLFEEGVRQAESLYRACNFCSCTIQHVYCCLADLRATTQPLTQRRYRSHLWPSP